MKVNAGRCLSSKVFIITLPTTTSLSIHLIHSDKPNDKSALRFADCLSHLNCHYTYRPIASIQANVWRRICLRSISNVSSDTHNIVIDIATWPVNWARHFSTRSVYFQTSFRAATHGSDKVRGLQSKPEHTFDPTG